MKYNEIYPPDLHEWTRPLKDIIVMEGHILKCLDFNLSYTSVESYLDFYFSKYEVDDSQKQMIQLIADVSAFDELMYAHTALEISQNIIFSVVDSNLCDELISKSLKWMLERN